MVSFVSDRKSLGSPAVRSSEIRMSWPPANAADPLYKPPMLSGRLKEIGRGRDRGRGVGLTLGRHLREVRRTPVSPLTASSTGHSRISSMCREPPTKWPKTAVVKEGGEPRTRPKPAQKPQKLKDRAPDRCANRSEGDLRQPSTRTETLGP